MNPIFRSFESEQTLGAAIKEDNDKISFVLIKVNSLAKLKNRYKKNVKFFGILENVKMY